MRTFISFTLLGLATTALAAPPGRPDSNGWQRPESSHSNHTEPASITASPHNHTEPSAITASPHSSYSTHEHNITHTEPTSAVSFSHISHPAYPTHPVPDDGKGPSGSRLVPGFMHHGHKREAEPEEEHHPEHSHPDHTEASNTTASSHEGHPDYEHSHSNHTETFNTTASSHEGHPDYEHNVTESDSDDSERPSGAHLVPGFGHWHGHKRDSEVEDDAIKGTPISLPAPSDNANADELLERDALPEADPDVSKGHPLSFPLTVIDGGILTAIEGEPAVLNTALVAGIGAISTAVSELVAGATMVAGMSVEGENGFFTPAAGVATAASSVSAAATPSA